MSGCLPLLGDEGGDLADRVEVFDAGFVSFDPDPEMFFEKNDQLEGADRVENSSRDQGRSIRELGRILAGKEFVQDESVNDLGNFFHDGLGPLFHA